jgi:hypothetical protein
LAWVVLTDGPPESLTVTNVAADAKCVVEFDGGEPPWKFQVARDETASKFFLFGIPVITSTLCQSTQAVTPVVLRHSWSCSKSDQNFAILLTDGRWGGETGSGLEC